MVNDGARQLLSTIQAGITAAQTGARELTGCDISWVRANSGVLGFSAGCQNVGSIFGINYS